MRGIKTYIVPQNINRDIRLMQDLKIDTVLLGDKASLSKEYVQSLNNASISTFLIFPVFYNPLYLKKNSDSWAKTQFNQRASDSWVKFVCPSDKEHLNYQKSKIEDLVRSVNPKGITLDFLRNFAFWEMIRENQSPGDITHGCFCSNCISDFSSEVSLPKALESVQLNEWILENEREAWSKWKQKKIIQAAEMLIKTVKDNNAEIKVAIHMVPWLRNEYKNGMESILGQNIESFSRISDFITPMAYGPMCFRNSQWINTLVTDFESQSSAKVVPSIQVKKAYEEEEITPERFRADLKSALSPPSWGVLLWSWETLKESPEKLQIFKES